MGVGLGCRRSWRRWRVAAGATPAKRRHDRVPHRLQRRGGRRRHGRGTAREGQGYPAADGRDEAAGVLDLHRRPGRRCPRVQRRCVLSVRDVEATLAGALGDQAAISKSTVVVVCQQIKDEYQAWACCCLDEVRLDYLFLDASFFRMHPGSPAEPVLAAWGITTEGKPAFIGLAPGFWGVRRRLARLPGRPQRPRTGHPRCWSSATGRAGLITAIEQTYPKGAQEKASCSSRGKCLGQGPGRDAGRGQGRLLEDLRYRRT